MSMTHKAMVLGAGLKEAELALATATETDVTEGKTFYAGNKTLKTGTSAGLKEAELALATATEADVLSGKTFYSKNRELKTGQLTPSTGIKLNVSNKSAVQTWEKTSVEYTLPAGDYKAYALMTMQTYPDDSNYLKCEVIAGGKVVATIKGLDILHDPASNYMLYYINKSAEFTLSKTSSVQLKITAYSKGINFGTWHTAACSVFSET